MMLTPELPVRTHSRTPAQWAVGIVALLVLVSLAVVGSACSMQHTTVPVPLQFAYQGHPEWVDNISTYRIRNPFGADISQANGQSVTWSNTTRIDKFEINPAGLPLTDTSTFILNPGQSTTRHLSSEVVGTWCYQVRWSPTGQTNWQSVQGADARACQGSPLMDTRPKIIVY